MEDESLCTRVDRLREVDTDCEAIDHFNVVYILQLRLDAAPLHVEIPPDCVGIEVCAIVELDPLAQMKGDGHGVGCHLPTGSQLRDRLAFCVQAHKIFHCEPGKLHVSETVGLPPSTQIAGAVFVEYHQRAAVPRCGLVPRTLRALQHSPRNIAGHHRVGSGARGCAGLLGASLLRNAQQGHQQQT